MGARRFGRIELDPAWNPAVLDTLTWDVPSALGAVLSAGSAFWESAAGALLSGAAAPRSETVTLFGSSVARAGTALYALTELSDGQHVIVRFGPPAPGEGFEGLIGEADAGGRGRAAVYCADSGTLHAVYAAAAPARLPSALGAVPRLGIGTRMSRLCFPGIWAAVRRGGFAANAIQNSRRELNLLGNVLGAEPSRPLYYPGFGFVEEGHTGSTFEGLWVCGVAESLKYGNGAAYGADADHIMVKRGAGGMEAARRVVEAARFYSFYTIDVSDLLDYGALRTPAGPAGKYGSALEAVEELSRHIAAVRGGEPFDLELSVDEHPPGIPASDCITGDGELRFLLSEAVRRGIPLTHVAPNVGVEKLLDYRLPDGLEGLAGRVRRQAAVARGFGVILDIHSGDDLSPATRRALGAASAGRLHFKVSPALQVLLGETVRECEPGFFGEWWADALRTAEDGAARGSQLAASCLASQGALRTPDPRSALFQAYCFAAVGRRDEGGAYRLRERFYSLSPECRGLYDRKVEEWLCRLAGDLFDPGL